YNFGTKMYFVGTDGCLEMREVATPTAVRHALELVFARSASNNVFVKRITGSLGAGAKRIAGTMPLADAGGMQLWQTIASEDVLFQEEIVQHADVCTLNPGCINTI